MGGAIIAGRLLGKEGYGELGLIVSTLSVFNVFAGFGLGLTATKFISEFKETQPARAARIIGISRIIANVFGLLVASTGIIFAPLLAGAVFNAPNLTIYIRLAAGAAWLYSLLSLEKGILGGFQLFQKLALIDIFQPLTQAILYIILISQWGVLGAIIAIFCTIFTTFLWARSRSQINCNQLGIRVSYKDVWKEIPVIWQFSLPAVISGAMVGPVIWATQTILARQSNGFQELGLFVAAFQWSQMVRFLPGILGRVTVPILSEIYGTGENDLFSKIIGVNVFLLWGVCLIVSFVGIAFSPFLMQCFGKQFKEGFQVLNILMIASCIAVPNSSLGHGLVSSGRMWATFWFNCGWGLALLGAAIILIPKFSAFGLALAYLVSYVCHYIWQFAYVEFVLKLNLFKKSIVFIALTILAVILALAYKDNYFWLIRISCGLAVLITLNCSWQTLPENFHAKLKNLIISLKEQYN